MKYNLCKSMTKTLSRIYLDCLKISTRDIQGSRQAVTEFISSLAPNELTQASKPRIYRLFEITVIVDFIPVL